MDICVKKKFIPQIQVEDVDINTTLFIFVQIISENVNTKKVVVHCIKNEDGGCIFDDIKDLVKTVSIELELVPIEREYFYSLNSAEDMPHVVYVGDLLANHDITEAMINSLPPSCFIINHGVDIQERLNKNFYCPLYTFGKGKDKLEISRWNVQKIWKQNGSNTRLAIADVNSEKDLEALKLSLKSKTIYDPLIVVTKYPDATGLKQIILDHRMLKDDRITYLVLANSEIDEETVKSKVETDLAFNILKDGVWGGEYYVPE